MATRHIAPDRIMQLGFGFWGSKTLLSAVELGLFTELAKGSREAKALAKRLNQEAGTDPDRVKRAFALLYGRSPSDVELKSALGFMAASNSAESGDSMAPLEQFCLAMLGTNEFAYVD